MNFIKVRKGMTNGRKNKILMEFISFQERLFERMQCPDYPILESLKMVKIIKGNIEEFCQLKLRKANMSTLYAIVARIEDLYLDITTEMNVRLMHKYRSAEYLAIQDSVKVDPVIISFKSAWYEKDSTESTNAKDTTLIFTDGVCDETPTENEILRIKISTPNFILAIEDIIKSIEELSGKDTSISFPRFMTKDVIHCDDIESLFTFNNDLIFRTPYDSYNIILSFIKGRLESSKVHTILMTLYRTATDSKIVDMLCEYGERCKGNGLGKRIFVYVETTASGNEELNKSIITRLASAGIYAIYGSDYKVHAKMFVAIGEHDMWAHFSTGNYNERSAAAYTDIQLLTRDRRKIIPAITTFYKFIWGRSEVESSVAPTNCIWFSPNNLKSTLIGLFREQIELKERGKITIKVNSIADDEILQYIYEAIENNVQVHIICRSICLIDPEYIWKPNLKLESYCGRFLEHDRIYGFGDRYFIASADLSFRNMHKRVESFIEMTDPACVKYLKEVVETMHIENPYKFIMMETGKWNLVPSCDNSNNESGA